MYVETTQVITLVLLTISLQNPRLVNGDDDLVTRLCKATTSYTGCRDCMVSVPGGVTTTDTGVLETVMTCATRAMDGLYQEAYAYQSKATDPALKDALDVCLDRNEATRPSMNEVVSKVRSRDFNSAKAIIISQILAVVNTCADDAKSKRVQLPLVVSNELEIVNDVWDGLVLKMLDSLR
ncbi:hypothetical protein RND81_13G137900 [Saponaria officinalis]|uniref:Pectinesterase inhibitor domain-containing protein n=1 Tax=Saponaria officinalis TaxID=3572 RepID=A0AAW1H0F9_SAPOF